MLKSTMWLLYFIMLLTTGKVLAQPCGRLLMQGVDNAAVFPYIQLSGIYQLSNLTLARFPVYRHEVLPDQYFYYNTTLGGLSLGGILLVGQTTGRLPRSNATFPYDEVITTWQVYQPSESSYRTVAGSYLRPRCVDTDPGLHWCDSGQLSFNNELTLTLEDGRVVNITRYEQFKRGYASNRPVYSAVINGTRSVKVYLYHADGFWRLGYDYRSPSALALVLDTALRPEYITNTWRLHYNGKWRDDPTRKLRCTGIPSAITCKDVQCQNGGTCVQTDNINIYCACPRGYHGTHCQQRTPSCKYFGNWTHDFGGYFYTTGSHVGSVTTWFCPQRSQPWYSFSLCENRYYGPLWSPGAYCRSASTPATTTTRWWYSTVPARPTDIFKDAHNCLLPTVLTIVCVLQLFGPFIIYFILRCCFGYNQKDSKYVQADENEDKATAAKFSKQLAELENQDPKAESAVKISQLRQIQQDMDNEIDKINASRRKRDRTERRSVRVCRIMSWFSYITFWLWLIYIIVAFAIRIGKYDQLFGILAIIGIICLIGLPIVFFIETWSSSERQYIKNLSSLTSATERIETIRETQPSVRMNAECFHYELRTRTVTYRDAQGNTHTRLETYQEKVVTAFIIEHFLFSHWSDSSQSTLTDIRKTGITKIKMNLDVRFGDLATAQHFTSEFDRFKDENRYRDVYVNFFVTRNVQGFEERLAAFTGTDSKPGWISSVWFWISTCLCLGWPYRIMFNHATDKTEYQVVKFIFVKNPDANQPATPPLASEDDIITRVKSGIESAISKLTSGNLSAESETPDIPIRCAATDQHMNIALREAHHVQQDTCTAESEQ